MLIPRVFAAVNDAYMFEDNARFDSAYREILKLEGDAARCVACGQGEDACPQHLPIIKLLEEAAARA